MYDFQQMLKNAERIKQQYPEGTRIHLINMDDPYAPVPSGTRGTVDHCDGAGQLHMIWDNGRTLALIPGVDDFRKLTSKELEEEQQQKDSLDKKIQDASEKAGNTNDSINDKHILHDNYEK